LHAVAKRGTNHGIRTLGDANNMKAAFSLYVLAIVSRCILPLDYFGVRTEFRDNGFDVFSNLFRALKRLLGMSEQPR
jgi:hypothetical protein